MNQRSFRRGMNPPELNKEWERKSEEFRETCGPLEDQLRQVFELILTKVIDEMKSQCDQGVGHPFKAWGILNGENGQSFKITIEGEPPSTPIIPSRN